jgi:uncharacterized protein YfiM (DUF2279 family)
VAKYAVVLVTIAMALPLHADLSAAMAEKNLEKRAAKALDNASAVLAAAQEAYFKKGDLSATNSALQELDESVALAYKSLIDTGKNPSKKSKHFKKAEIRTRELVRKLTDFRDRMSAMDRDRIQQVQAAVLKIHDDLLAGIMGSKHRQ